MGNASLESSSSPQTLIYNSFESANKSILSSCPRVHHTSYSYSKPRVPVSTSAPGSPSSLPLEPNARKQASSGPSLSAGTSSLQSEKQLCPSTVSMPIYGHRQNHKVFLEPDIFPHLLLFIMDRSLLKCLSVCPHWFVTIYAYLQQLTLPLLQRFHKTYKSYMDYATSAISFQPLCNAHSTDVRIDLLLYVKVLPKCVGHFTEFGYQFKYLTPTTGTPGHSKQSDLTSQIQCPHQSTFDCKSLTQFKSVFCFETKKQHSSRHVWFDIDKCHFHGDEIMLASIPSVPTVNAEDLLEIPINLANAFGLIDLSSVQWASPSFTNLSPKTVYRRESDIELRNFNWVSLDAFQPLTSLSLRIEDDHAPQWKHLKTEFAGIDITYSRSKYVATMPGEVPKSYEKLGMVAIVKPKETPIVYSLTRLGLEHDRFTVQHLRVGDTVTIYTSRGGLSDI